MNGSPGGHTWPAACRIRPKLGSPPWSADLTSGELATARATGSTVSGAAGDDDAADAPGALAVVDDLEGELAQQRVERLAEGELVRRPRARPARPTPRSPGR